MITKFKVFEKNISRKPEFSVGDFVYADNIMNSLELDNDVKYKIKEVLMDDSFGIKSYKYKLKEYPDTCFFEYRFISELEYNAKKYNL